jgi:hypothetical protein
MFGIKECVVTEAYSATWRLGGSGGSVSNNRTF